MYFPTLPSRRKTPKPRARSKVQATRKHRKLVPRRPQRSPQQRDEVCQKCLNRLDSVPATIQTSVEKTSGNCPSKSPTFSKLRVHLRMVDAGEMEFNKKIAEARALLHSNHKPSRLDSPDASYSDSTLPPASATTPPPPEHYSPVVAVPSASLQTVKPQLRYATGIGIAMTEHERSLLETLLPGWTESEDLSPIENNSEMRSQVGEISHSYTGYAVRYDDSDLDDEASEVAAELLRLE